MSIVDSEPGPRNVSAVGDGRFDVAFTNIPYFLWAKQDEPEINARFVFMTTRRPPWTAFVLGDRPAAHGRPIESFADLGGASYLVRTEPPEDFDDYHVELWRAQAARLRREYAALLSQLGLQPGPAVDIGGADLREAWAAGAGDVSIGSLPALPNFREATMAVGAEVRALPFYQAGVKGYGSGFVASPQVLASRPEAVRRFVAALRDAVVTAQAAPEPGIEALRRLLPDAQPDGLRASWEAMQPLMSDDEGSPVGTMDVVGWKETLAHSAAVHGTPDLAPEEMFAD